jgi:hypothetical protein
MMDGRAYFKKWARTYRLENLDPDVIEERRPSGLKRGTAESKLGGRITRDLTSLSPEEVAQRRNLSEEFLKQPPVRFTADEHVDC